MNKIYLVYFSATNTTKKVLDTIAKGTKINNIIAVDFTLPENRNFANLSFDKDSLIIFGAPVYMGRVQKYAAEYLNYFKGEGQPSVCVVTFGNRAFNDALLELTDIVRANGFNPIAAAAFIGEHSFSDEKFLIAKNRPDDKDLSIAYSFGETITQKLNELNLDKIEVPGNKPYKKPTRMPKVAPTKKSNCINCGTCQAMCPVGAIDSNAVGDKNKCILCMACIKSCPYAAREIKSMMLGIAKKTLAKQSRKEPELFI